MMQAGTTYIKPIVYRICAEYGLEVPGSKRVAPPDVVENGKAKILWDFQIQTDGGAETAEEGSGDRPIRKKDQEKGNTRTQRGALEQHQRPLFRRAQS